MGILDFLKDTFGIDPGSQQLRIIKDNKLIFNEASKISIDTEKNSISGIGDSVRTSASDQVIKPVNYVIADFQGFEMLLRGAIKKSVNAKSFPPKSYNMYFCLPSNATEVEKRAYRDSAEHAGAVEVYMLYQSCAAALGMNIFEKKDFILIDFSASKTEITVFANGLIISDGHIRMGTWRMARAIKNHLFRHHKISFTDSEAEAFMVAVTKNNSPTEIKAHHVSVNSKEIDELLKPFYILIKDELLETIERVASHPNIDRALTNGIYFTGGGSLIEGLRKQINPDPRIQFHVSPSPLLDNINGLKIVMTDKERYRNYLLT